MKPVKIAILGTRGIPNTYGGFEQAAEHLSTGLAERGHRVTVYSPHSHPYQDKSFGKVSIVHCHEPRFLGTAGQFIYDLNCIRDAAKRRFDILLLMGYTSSSVWWPFYPKGSHIVSNMDGLEWKRSKYSRLTQRFLRLAEKLAVKHSHKLVADSPGIQAHVSKTFGRPSVYIAYGASIPGTPDASKLAAFGLRQDEFFLLVARMEPENHIEMVIQGYLKTSSERALVIVGNTSNRHGSYLSKQYACQRILFVNGIYDADTLNALRHFSAMYFHGHSVGGTNPSLLEAMACGCYIAAHANEFNRHILGRDASYFDSAGEVAALIAGRAWEKRKESAAEANISKIREHFNWEKITGQYEALFLSLEG